MLRQLRTCKVVMCNDFCQEVFGNVFIESMKLEMLQEIQVMRKRAHLLPKDSMVHHIWKPNLGEHEFAYYRDTNDMDAYTMIDPHEAYFFSLTRMKIMNWWRIPPFVEVLEKQVNFNDFKAKNLRNLFDYKLCDPLHKDKSDLSEFR